MYNLNTIDNHFYILLTLKKSIVGILFSGKCKLFLFVYLIFLLLFNFCYCEGLLFFCLLIVDSLVFVLNNSPQWIFINEVSHLAPKLRNNNLRQVVQNWTLIIKSN